jgi:hypothetical protein
VARDQHFADSQSGKVKDRVVRIREVRTREKITVVDRSEIIETVHRQGGHVVRDQHFIDS